MKLVKFILLCVFSTCLANSNIRSEIGDDMQAIAARKFLSKNSIPSDRFDGLDNLVTHCNQWEFLNGEVDVDLENPPESYLELRESLVKILISEEEIAEKVASAAADLNTHFKGKEVTIVAILKGSICFLADLIRHLEFPFQLEFVSAASYGMRGTKPGELKLSGFEGLNLKGKNVLLVDDIYDTGKTLSAVFHAIETKQPKSLQTLVLLRKKVDHMENILPDRVCFDIEDHFVIGYGLDYKELLRGLKAIYTVEE